VPPRMNPPDDFDKPSQKFSRVVVESTIDTSLFNKENSIYSLTTVF